MKFFISNFLITQTYAFFGDGGMEVKAKAKLGWDMTNVRFLRYVYDEKKPQRDFNERKSGGVQNKK